MENKGMAIGCGAAVLVVVLLCGGVAIGVWSMVRYAGQQVGNVINEQLEAEAARQDAAAGWRPPAEDAPAESLFPPQVAEYALASHDESSLPELNIDRDGRRGEYQADGRRIDVYLFPMSSEEAEEVFSGVQTDYEAEQNQSGSRSWSSIRTSDEFARAYVNTSTLGQNYLWFVKGWLLVFRSETAEDIEPFVHAFLRESSADAVEAPAPSEPASDEN
jgi:hypothetical protein